MNTRLPPANWLRTFELVARNMSFTEAAEQLNISTSAVSQQIKRLEEFFNCKLFRRVGNRLCLTDAAETCIPAMRHAFMQIEQAVDQIYGLEQDNNINISVAPSFASKWLMARIGRFYEQFPSINLSIFSTVSLASFDHNDVDLAIRYGTGIYPGLETHKLMSEKIVAVASPSLIAEVGGIDTLDDLKKTALLHDCSGEVDRTCPDWQSIANAFQAEDMDYSHGPKYNQSALVVDAAVEGCGVGLVKYNLAKRDIEKGTLQCLFDWSFDVNNCYYLLHISDDKISKKIEVFKKWIFEEINRSSMDDNSRN